MVEEPDRIRDRIEVTRSELARNVDELADRTMPSRIARRQWTNMTERMHRMGEKVMGTPRSVATSVGDAASRVEHKAEDLTAQAAEAGRELPHKIAQQTQGNPLAAGVIAFGAGLLAASLLPASRWEREAGVQVKENAGEMIEPLRQPVAESAQRLKQDLGEAAADATQAVKQTAQEAVHATTGEAKSAARQMTEQS